MFDHIAFPTPYQTLELPQPVQLTIKRLDQIHPQISGNKFLNSNTTSWQHNSKVFSSPHFWRCIFQSYCSNGLCSSTLWLSKYWHHSWSRTCDPRLKSYPTNSARFWHATAFCQPSRISSAPWSGIFTTTSTAISSSLYYSWRWKQCPCHSRDTGNPLPDDLENYDVICCAVGTGGTLAGIIESSSDHQHILGFSALKVIFSNRTFNNGPIKAIGL